MYCTVGSICPQKTLRATERSLLTYEQALIERSAVLAKTASTRAAAEAREGTDWFERQHPDVTSFAETATAVSVIEHCNMLLLHY